MRELKSVPGMIKAQMLVSQGSNLTSWAWLFWQEGETRLQLPIVIAGCLLLSTKTVGDLHSLLGMMVRKGESRFAKKKPFQHLP